MAESVTSIPGTRHKVIGLVSGGKDSCFNLMHCVANGHELVGIATLQPEPGVGELIASYVHSRLFHLLPTFEWSSRTLISVGLLLHLANFADQAVISLTSSTRTFTSRSEPVSFHS